MLQSIRDRATGWIAYIIVGLLIIPFALWGVHQYSGGGEQPNVAKVGDTTISQQEFRRAYQQQRLRIQNLLGERFDPALFDEDRLRQEVLEQLVNERVLIQVAREQGFRVGDQHLHEVIRSIDAFQRGGAFDVELYRTVLRTQGYGPVAFEEGMRESLLSGQLRQGVSESALVTPVDVDTIVGLLAQQRELSYVVLPLDTYLAGVSVDEVAVEAYFQENRQRFMKPEQVRIDYVELEMEQVAEEIPVTEEALRAAYQEQIARYTRPEERSASHILVRIPEQAGADEIEQARSRAQEIYETIASGRKSFQEVLAEIQAGDREGIEGGELGAIGRGMLDPSFEEHLYALEAVGDVSEPVLTSFGFHIIRLDDIAPGQVKAFEEVRDEVARELRRRQAEGRFYDMAETLFNLSYEHPDTLEPAADTLDLKIQESPWFSRRGGEGIAGHPEVVTAAFSEEVLQRGLNSDPIEVGVGPHHVVVLRVKEHQEATPLALEEARDDIVRELRLDLARQTLHQDIEALQRRAEQGEDLQDLAEAFGGELKTPGRVGRDADSVPQAVLAAAFRLPGPEEGQRSLGTARLPDGDEAVIAVTRVVPGKLEDLPDAERKALQEHLARQTGMSEFEALLASLRERVDVRLYEDRL